MTISLRELNPKGFPVSEEQAGNLKVLLERMNLVRAAYGKPMMVTSGLRSVEDHKRIYLQKAQREGIANIRIPMGSKHLSGQAVDIADPDGALYRWCKENESVLVEAKLWCEDDPATPRVHFQTVPPASGKRWFKP